MRCLSCWPAVSSAAPGSGTSVILWREFFVENPRVAVLVAVEVLPIEFAVLGNARDRCKDDLTRVGLERSRSRRRIAGSAAELRLCSEHRRLNWSSPIVVNGPWNGLLMRGSTSKTRGSVVEQSSSSVIRMTASNAPSRLKPLFAVIARLVRSENALELLLETAAVVLPRHARDVVDQIRRGRSQAPGN